MPCTRPTARGSFIATSSPATWDIFFDLSIGRGGRGELAISNGGSVHTDAFGSVGTFANSNGLLHIGSGASLDNTWFWIALGTSSQAGATVTQADLDHDNDVDLIDFRQLQTRFAAAAD